jgi:hypothetical protein
MKKWQQLVMVFALVTGIGAAVLPATSASAINVFPSCGAGGSGGGSTAVCGSAGNDNAQSMAQKIVSTLLFILGILAVIMIIVGGIRYVTSAGDASRVKAAKDTVMYSVVGLVVAILAYAIVTFVVGRF